MHALAELFENNQNWADSLKKADPQFFSRVARGQHPRYLWIGCSDSRVQAGDIIGALPGEVFVHRNIANLVLHTDLSAMSVLHYAVQTLQVPHIILCGHTNCGGIHAALQRKSFGLVDGWLAAIHNLYHEHHDELDAIDDPDRRADRLAQLNVHRQVRNICSTAVVQDAWRNGQALAVHGIMYDLATGLLSDIGLTVTGPDALPPICRFIP